MEIRVEVEVKTAFGREDTTVVLSEDDIRRLAESLAREWYACVERVTATEVRMMASA